MKWARNNETASYVITTDMSLGLRNTFTNILAFTKTSEDSVWHTFKTKLVTHLCLLNSHSNVWNWVCYTLLYSTWTRVTSGLLLLLLMGFGILLFTTVRTENTCQNLPRVLFHGQESVISPTESIISKNQQENLQFFCVFSSTRNCKQVNHDREQSEEQTKICYSRLY